MMDTVDILHTSDKKSNTLICWEYEQAIPTQFKDIDKMNYAHLSCLQEHPSNVKMELINVKSWNKNVLRIKSDNKKQLSALKHSMTQKFKYVTYQRQENGKHNKLVYNAENHNNAENKSDFYSNYSDDADEDSEHSASHKTKRYKKSPKKIRKEREIREHKKKKPTPPLPATPSSQSYSGSPKSNSIQTVPSHFAPPPNFAIDDYDPSHNHIINEKHSSPPKPSLNFQQQIEPNLQKQQPQIVENKENKENKGNKEKEMRPSLPVFDFGVGIQYNDDGVSENKSSMDSFETNPHFVDNQYLSSPPPIPIKYKKPQNRYNKYSNNRYNNNNHHDNKYNNNKFNNNNVNRYNNNNNYNKYSYNNNNKLNNNNNKHDINNNNNNYNKPQNKKARSGPVLSGLFGDCQSHDEYLTFHTNARRQYSEKLKTSAKREKNPKNYFLLPILTKLPDYEIGTRIGARDYGFICDSGLSKGPLKGRDSNSYHGVDFQDKKSEKEDNKIQQDDKNPISLLFQVMVSLKFQQETDYKLAEYFDQRNMQRAQFQFQFILHSKRIAFGEGNTKKQAKKRCAQNALNVLRQDSNFRSVIIRKESGIKGSGKKDEAPPGYEYQVVLSGRYGGKYSYVMIASNNTINLQRKNSGYDRHSGHGMDIFMDRGYFRNYQTDNPNVEELYAKHWAIFQGDHSIPKHRHPYLDERGKFIKQFSNANEKRLWKDIWKAMKGHSLKNNWNQQKQQKQRPQPQQPQSFESKSAYKEDGNGANNNVMRNNELETSHLIIYDFDGCVYAQRLLRESKQYRDPNKYLSELSDKEITEIGWRVNRIDAIKNHFNKLIKYKPTLGIVLHSFHKLEHLEKVFNAINVNMNDYFNLVLCEEHMIVKYVNARQNGGKYSKNMMVKRLCEKYDVSTNNTLYVDDDPNQDVKCCQVFITQKRDGICKQEMDEIESRIIYQYKLGQQNNYNDNNSNVYMENCCGCLLSFNKKEMRAHESFWLCKTCHYNNCDANRMNNARSNQYY